MTPAHEAGAILTRDYPGGSVYVTNRDTAVVELDGTVAVTLHRWTEGNWTATVSVAIWQLSTAAPTPDAALTALRARLREQGWDTAADLIEPQPAPERT